MTRTGSLYAVRRALYTACFFSAVLSWILPAQAQDTNSRLQRIENEIQTLSRAVFKGEKPPAGSFGEGVSAGTAANTEVRLQQIEMDLRNLTGAMEQRNFEMQQFQAQMQQAISSFEMRIAELEMQVRGGTVQMSAPPPQPGYPSYTSSNAGMNVSAGLGNMEGNLYTGDTPSYEERVVALDAPDTDAPAMPDESVSGQQLGTLRNPADAGDAVPGYESAMMTADDPVGIYERAFSFLRDKDYDQAAVVFQDFLSRYPNHDLAGNAKYWLGESYYVRNDFERAARVFAEAYQQYPKGPKGPDNLLKLGMSLAGLGKTDDACLTYAQLQKDYPNGAMPILMRAEQEMEKLSCQQL